MKTSVITSAIFAVGLFNLKKKNLKNANCREFWKAMRYVNKKQTGIPSLSVGTGNLVTDARENCL